VAGDFGLCDGRAADATLEGDPLPRRCCTVTESSLYDADASAIEVLIYRGDQLIARALCESEEDAAAVVDRWSELRNVNRPGVFGGFVWCLYPVGSSRFLAA
jgi:hypothetical protein